MVRSSTFTRGAPTPSAEYALNKFIGATRRVSRITCAATDRGGDFVIAGGGLYKTRHSLPRPENGTFVYAEEQGGGNRAFRRR